MAGKIRRLKIKIDDAAYDRLLGLLALEAPYGWEETPLPDGKTEFTLHSENPAPLENLLARIRQLIPDSATEMEELENQDWLAAWREFFTPVLCGSRFVVLPPWLADQDFGGRQKLLIEPKSAFGTGHHASTALCLAAISDLADAGILKAGQSVLDLGCGSGILALAASALGMHGIGLDIDQLAVDNARENMTLNNAANLRFELGSLEVAAGREYDLVLANILAGPLVEMAPGLAQLVAGDGALVLSGILADQAQKVLEAYQDQGLEIQAVRDDGEWRALVLRRPRK